MAAQTVIKYSAESGILLTSNKYLKTLKNIYLMDIQ